MSVQLHDPADILAAVSDSLAGAVERAGASVVRVDGRARQAASGVVWSAGGVIVTANHVVERDDNLSVVLPDGTSRPAKLAGRDPETDLALLRVEAQALTPIQPGPVPRLGHQALVVARPGPLAVSSGVVSALDGGVRTWRGRRLEGLIRTDAAFYPGFSGGPVIDTAGRMIGLATSHFGGATGVAIPFATVERVVTAIESGGQVRRGYLGLGSQPVALPESVRIRLGLSQETGLLVIHLEPGGPADRAGLLIGDILIGLDSRLIGSTEDLFGLLGPDRVGQSLPARVIRGGELHDLNVAIGERR
ncbi:MAG TPA: trypsin-like peptidase domain-containing protein [Dehalococcoidia bacterium]|nr:trypsin-like peptidase domain-containing protein [Dehalococcoidia bacterium]